MHLNDVLVHLNEKIRRPRATTVKRKSGALILHTSFLAKSVYTATTACRFKNSLSPWYNLKGPRYHNSPPVGLDDAASLKYSCSRKFPPPWEAASDLQTCTNVCIIWFGLLNGSGLFSNVSSCVQLPVGATLGVESILHVAAKTSKIWCTIWNVFTLNKCVFVVWCIFLLNCVSYSILKVSNNVWTQRNL